MCCVLYSFVFCFHFRLVSYVLISSVGAANISPPNRVAPPTPKQRVRAQLCGPRGCTVGELAAAAFFILLFLQASLLCFLFYCFVLFFVFFLVLALFLFYCMI
ncbi:unnamed protein product [Polarella glacialis]|uniref:Uncharacterized protein n=1 Tax=Polarella glacialis TaxID=89957 RepID=A0A813F1R5_POLGL|nr:unnamed protein product [Polarella glacialis]